jgi:2-methylcitrate dehydratase
MSTVAEILSEFARSLCFEDLPETVVHEVKRRVIDSVGCALGAFHERPVTIARSLALEVSSHHGATILGADCKSSPEMAAFVNGTMIRYLDYNDTYLSLEPAHPSDNLSAALAVAEAEDLGGEELITALVIGYEVQCRLCDAQSLRTRGWDHVTYGVLSTALVAGKLLGLRADEMVHALGLAGVPNIALRQTRVGELSMWKGCAFANAARNGIFAAMLAQHGMTGPTPLFEGEKGFFQLVSGPFCLPPLGKPFKILDTSIKFYPAEYHAQTAIQAALELCSQVPSVREVARIGVEACDACVDIIAAEPEKWRPTTRETADHSLPYCVAVTLVDGNVTLKSFTPERISSTEIYEIMQKITVSRNPELSAQYPEATPSEISIELKAGKVIQRKVTHARGHPKNPMTDAEVGAKFRALAAPILTEKRGNQILARLWRLEEISDIGSLLSLLVVR